MRYAATYGLMVATVFASGVVAQTGAQAGNHGNTLVTVAERWGLWAAITLALGAFCIWTLYKQSQFVQTTLVQLVIQNQKCIDGVAAAIRAAPDDCPVRKGWDSDSITPDDE